MRTPTWCRTRAADVGPACVEVVAGLLIGNALFMLRSAQGVLGLADKYDAGRLEAACVKAIAAGDPSYRTSTASSPGAPKPTQSHRQPATAAPQRTCTDLRSSSPTSSPCPRRTRHTSWTRPPRPAPTKATRTPDGPSVTVPPDGEHDHHARSSNRWPDGLPARTLLPGDLMTVVDTALRDSLRALKLSGMLHTLDARLAQARAGELGHVHNLVTSTVEADARLAAGGTYEGLFYRPTVLDGVRAGMPAYAEEVFGPVAPVSQLRRGGPTIRAGPCGVVPWIGINAHHQSITRSDLEKNRCPPISIRFPCS
jgi:hypothetical protein